MPDWVSIGKQLREPFAANEIFWRVGSVAKSGNSATLLAYLDARAVMDRLDAVVGPGGWSDAYYPSPCGGVQCTLSIYGVPKSDSAENTKVEAVKGGVSDAFKRAAVKWGIGRYLYSLPTKYYPIKDGYGPDHAVNVKGGHIIPPQLPGWALPQPKPKPSSGRRLTDVGRDLATAKTVKEISVIMGGLSEEERAKVRDVANARHKELSR